MKHTLVILCLSFIVSCGLVQTKQTVLQKLTQEVEHLDQNIRLFTLEEWQEQVAVINNIKTIDYQSIKQELTLSDQKDFEMQFIKFGLVKTKHDAIYLQNKAENYLETFENIIK